MDENTLLQLNDLLHDYGRAWQQIEQYTCPATQSAHIKARNAIVAFIEVQRQPGAAQETSVTPLMVCGGCKQSHPGFDPDGNSLKWQRDMMGQWFCDECSAG